MNKYMLLILLFFSTNSFSVEIRLDNPWQPGGQLQTQNQGDSGICYAYAASYLIDHKRLRELGRIEFKSSPLKIALDYKRQGLLQGFFRGQNPDGGTICKAIKAVKKVSPKSLEHNLIENRRYKHFVYDMHQLYKIRKSNTFKSQLQYLVQKYFDSHISIPGYIKNIFSFKKFLVRILESAAYHQANSVNISCKKIHKLAAKQNIFYYIQSELRQDRPVGIEYCSRVLYPKNKVYKCGPHASVIIGVRKIHDQYQYLIQNSWGTDCSKYRWHCEQGKIWVNQQALKKAMFSIAVVH